MASGYGPMAAPSYASWGARVGGYIVDALVFAIPTVVAAIILRVGPKSDSLSSCTVNGEAALCQYPSPITWILGALVGIGGFIAMLIFQAKRQGATGQTVGAKAVGIKLVDRTSGQPIGTGGCIGRFFARVLSAIPCYVGFLWPLWDKEKQTFHDKVMNTVVVKA
jgi:uncharacterized RDD family membrane protein YckC